MDNVSWHAKHIINEKNPEIALYRVNSKLQEFPDHKDKFIFLKKVNYYATQRLADHKRSIYLIKQDQNNPDVSR